MINGEEKKRPPQSSFVTAPKQERSSDQSAVLNCICASQVPLEKLGITEEQLQRKRKKIGRQAYKKFTNEDDSDSEVERKTTDYGSQRETDVPGVMDGCVPLERMNHVPQRDNRLPGNISQVKTSEYGYDQEGNEGQMRHFYKGQEQLQNGGPQPQQENALSGVAPGSDQFKKVEATSVAATQVPPAGMPLSTEVSLKTYLKSIIHMPRSLQVRMLQFLLIWHSVCFFPVKKNHPIQRQSFSVHMYVCSCCAFCGNKKTDRCPRSWKRPLGLQLRIHESQCKSSVPDS